MHHKGRQCKPNSPLLLQRDCSFAGFSASLLCAGNQDHVGFVKGFFLKFIYFFSAVILVDSLPHLLRKGTTGIRLIKLTANSLSMGCYNYILLFKS